MRTINKQELKDILDKHGKWIRSEEGGERANLISADLSSADLSSADLSFADLSFADLSSADLSSADLSSADLGFANLRSANLSSADLSSANLISADLSSADLISADLSSANLSFADLSSANLVVFRFQKHCAYFTFDGALRIGCHLMPISEWELGFREIGKKEGYSDLQIEMYGDFISSCADKFRRGLFNVKVEGGGD